MARIIYSKDPAKYVPALAEALKTIKELSAPEWAIFVKSGTSRERPPVDENFWYTRAASILRQLYIRGVVGVGRFRVRYGSRKDRGGRRGEFRKSGGKIIRLILQQAESAGLVEKVTGTQFGRRLTKKVRDFLDSIDVEETKGIDFDSVILEKRAEMPTENYDEELEEDLEESEEDGK